MNKSLATFSFNFGKRSIKFEQKIVLTFELARPEYLGLKDLAHYEKLRLIYHFEEHAN